MDPVLKMNTIFIYIFIDIYIYKKVNFFWMFFKDSPFLLSPKCCVCCGFLFLSPRTPKEKKKKKVPSYELTHWYPKAEAVVSLCP